MLRKALYVLLAGIASLAGVTAGGGHGLVARGDQACATAATFRGSVPEVAAAHGPVTVSNNLLMSVRSGKAEPAIAPGMIRHVATSPGVGTAYVIDRRGPDVVVAETPDGVVELPQRSEALHPSWSSRGDLVWSVGSGLRLRLASSGRIHSVRAPVAGALLFSPVFRSAARIVAVLSMPPTNTVPEDERLNNLWQFDVGSHHWRQLTEFTAGQDRWTAIRTPVVRAGGAIEFVRIRGRGSASVPPVYELWTLRGRRASALRRLGGEQYLAGFDAGGRLWNIPDPSLGTFRLVRESLDGRRTDLGCGAVTADPMDAVDPDRRSRRGALVPPRGHWPDLVHHDSAGSAAPTVEVAVLVGDFSTVEAADDAAARITAAYGAGSPVEVIDSVSAPTALRPGAYGAILRLAPDVSPTLALAEFRARIPEYATSSWVVAP